MNFVYAVKDNIYINLTNKCPNNCSFCIRNGGDGVYGSDSLWLEREPETGDVISDLRRYDVDGYNEIVFCGYGEPTERLDVLLETAAYIKKQYAPAIRLNTNGQSDLINKKPTAHLFGGLVDIMSISLNAPSAREYGDICFPVYENAFDAVISFGRECKKYVPQVIFSVIKEILTEEQLGRCKKIAGEEGVSLRIRSLD